MKFRLIRKIMPEVVKQVRFLLGFEPVELDLDHHPLYHPSTTVLDYLRSLNGFRGVKEGCAEGDCGACTVVVAYPDGPNRLKYMAVNSCLIFLPWLHGKQLITVEHLAERDRLHPVQELMVDLYGSQCGFCTPGIIMSLFGLFKSSLPPTRENAVRHMSGNLCRCTGYQPILEAAVKALESNIPDKFSEKELEVLEYLLPASRQRLELDNGRQKYYRPFTLEDALALRKEHPEALLVNGSTDVALLQSKKFQFLPSILDLSGIAEIRKTGKNENYRTIGAGMSIEEMRNSDAIKVPLFKDLFSVFASHQIRNLATLGGNIGSASPIGDALPVLFALRASLELCSTEYSRLITIEDFILGYRKTALLPDEIIRSVQIPHPEPGTHYRFYKVSRRRELDISTVSLAARLKLDKNGRVAEVILAYGGMAATTVRAKKTEALLTGKIWSRETAIKAAAKAGEEFSPISDARSVKEARQLLAGNLIIKLFTDTCGKEVQHES